MKKYTCRRKCLPPLFFLWGGLLLLKMPVLLFAEEKGKEQPAPVASQTGETKAKPGEDFIVGPGDILNVFVWREPDLSKNVTVSPDGKISLPLINELPVNGLTVQQIREKIIENLKKFISEPSVNVSVETINSQKVLVSGEVVQGGPKPLTGPMHVMDILSSAGFTPFAKTTKISIIRTENGIQQRYKFNYKDFIKGKNPDQNILLKNGDTIVVP